MKLLVNNQIVADNEMGTLYTKKAQIKKKNTLWYTGLHQFSVLTSQKRYMLASNFVANKPNRPTQYCTQFKPSGNKTFFFQVFPYHLL